MVGVAQIEPDRLGLGVLLVGMDTIVAAAESRQAIAAERGGHVALGVAVDGHRAGPQHATRKMRASHVRGEHRGVEAVVGVVGHGDALVSVGEGRHRQHRTEDLVTSDGHVGSDVGEDRRLDEPAAGLGTGLVPAATHRGSLVLGLLDVREDLLHMGGLDVGIERITKHPLVHGLVDPVERLVRNRLVQQPVRRAVLAGDQQDDDRPSSAGTSGRPRSNR